MKKYLIIILLGFLFFSGQASAAPSNLDKITKSFNELNKAQTYHVFINNTISSKVKNTGKKDKNEVDLLSTFSEMISSKSISEIKVDRSEKNNDKIYASVKTIGGMLSGMSVQAVKFGDYEYLRAGLGDSDKNKWKKTTSTFEKTSDGSFFGTSTQHLVFTSKLLQQYKKDLKIVKLKEGIINDKLSEHFHVIVPMVVIKKVINEYASQQGVDLTLFNKNKSKYNYKNMILDIWLDKKTHQLTQNNILFSIDVKSASSILSLTSLSETTFVSINKAVNIYAPVISVPSSSPSQIDLVSTSASTSVSTTIK